MLSNGHPRWSLLTTGLALSLLLSFVCMACQARFVDNFKQSASSTVVGGAEPAGANGVPFRILDHISLDNMRDLFRIEEVISQLQRVMQQACSSSTRKSQVVLPDEEETRTQFPVDAPNGCTTVSDKPTSVGKCTTRLVVESCFTLAHGLQWRVWIYDPNGVIVNGGYWQSLEGAMQHAMQDYAGQSPACLQP